MRRVIKIELVDNNKIICHFDKMEVRILDLALSIKDKYAEEILSKKEVFETARIGEFGEIYWPDLAEITNLNGEIISCDYDISPEFAYLNSKSVDQIVHSQI